MDIIETRKLLQFAANKDAIERKGLVASPATGPNPPDLVALLYQPILVRDPHGLSHTSRPRGNKRPVASEFSALDLPCFSHHPPTNHSRYCISCESFVRGSIVLVTCFALIDPLSATKSVTIPTGQAFVASSNICSSTSNNIKSQNPPCCISRPNTRPGFRLTAHHTDNKPLTNYQAPLLLVATPGI
jgi:hypothetical protein